MTILPWNIEFSSADSGLSLELDHDFESGETVLTLTNTSGAALRPETVTLTSVVPLKAAGGSLWLHGRTPESDTHIRVLGADEAADFSHSGEASEDGYRYASQELAVISAPSQGQPSLVIGSLEPVRYRLDIAIDTDESDLNIQQISLNYDLESSVEIAAGESLSLPTLHIVEGAEPVALIEAYADAVTAKLVARVPRAAPAGLRVSAAPDSLDNNSVPGRFVITEDVNDASRIREAGFEAGYAFLPLAFPRDSAQAVELRDLLLRDNTGEVYSYEEMFRGWIVALDCTNPAAQAWLRESIADLVARGVTYLELRGLDCVEVLAENANYTEAGTTSLSHLRRALEVIREAAGEEVVLAAADGTFGSAIGLVDVMRVAPSSDGDFASAARSGSLALLRGWMHGRWWANDGGFVSTIENATAAESRFLRTVAALSGSATFANGSFDSADIALFPPANIAPRPEDPQEGPFPLTWRIDLGEKRSLVGLLNPSDSVVWVSQSQFLAAGEVAFDPWATSLAGMGDIRLDPHDGLLYQVSTPPRGARVTGDSGHITMDGLTQREVSDRVQVKNERPYARTIAVTARRNTTLYTLKPGEFRWYD